LSFPIFSFEKTVQQKKPHFLEALAEPYSELEKVPEGIQEDVEIEESVDLASPGFAKRRRLLLQNEMDASEDDARSPARLFGLPECQRLQSNVEEAGNEEEKSPTSIGDHKKAKGDS
jgi:hypothetical protein